MGRWLQLAVVTSLMLSGPLHAQPSSPVQSTGAPLEQTTPPNPAQPVTPGLLLKQNQQQQSTGWNPALYHELDLLRRDGFAAANEASVSLRIVDHEGITPPNLQTSDITLTVNGKPREFRLHTPGSQTAVVQPMVLLVFPPNDPIVHAIGVKQAVQYFSQQPAELLPWRVGIFDSNGKMTPFTNGRSQLLVFLDDVAHAKEPFQYANNVTLPAHFRWEGSWLTEAQVAISTMQRYEGPKIILAMNPISGSIYGLNDQVLSHDGPEDLIGVAQHIGAHIYIGNVGGPDVFVPGGEAASDQPAQINTANGPLLGTTPASHMQVDPAMNAALTNSAYRSSEMMQTADATYGGFANSLKDLASQIQHNLTGNYSLDFDLTPEDRDRGFPDVEVRLARHDLRVAILDVIPIGVFTDIERDLNQKELAGLFKKAAATPVSAPEFRITQHVDYFPLRQGLEPLLPMSSVVEWTGHGRGPVLLRVVESVEDENLSTTILEREIHIRWDGRSLSWERDGQLRPGRYLWRIVVHDGHGNVYAYSEKKVAVDFPRPTAIAASSLILGKSCRDDAPQTTGLQHRSPPDQKQPAHLVIDPMRAGDCRLKSDTLGSFAPNDTVHAFVRIYPAGKLDKNKPESWKAKFMLRTPSGLIETEQEIPFTIDSGTGYLASVQMPLSTAGITPGPHTLDVEMRGPGIRGDLKASRPISIRGEP